MAQKVFASPEAASKALVDALETDNKSSYGQILGSNWREFIPTEDIERFLNAWLKSNIIQYDTPDVAYLSVGVNRWVFPIPIVKAVNDWRFDVIGGAEQIRTRRIGRNELSAIEATLAYHDAQIEYAQIDFNDDGILEYAQQLISTAGKQDGLYWAALPGEVESPLGPMFGEDKPGSGYHGYYFKILNKQGHYAKDGAFDYRIGKRMTGGYALVAWPIKYNDTGIMAFMVNYNGVVYEKNLGPSTNNKARAITSFNPDES